MFKNANFFRLLPHWTPDLTQVQDALSCAAFTPCGATQTSSMGWVPPREVNGAMVEAIGGHWIAKLVIETKAVPASAVKDAVNARIEKYKEETGHERVGSKIKKEFKEEVLIDLLPRAFPKRSSVLVWINPVDKLLVIDAASISKADAAVSMLVQCIPEFGVRMLQTALSTSSMMSSWLMTNEVPDSFCVARELSLEAQDDSKASVKYARHVLETDEIKTHIRHGKAPTKLAVVFEDRMSFVLGEDLTIRNIEFLDVVTDSIPPETDAFDGDVAITTGELCKFLPVLLEALGGEIEPQPELDLAGTDDSGEPTPEKTQFEKAISVVQTTGKASISLIQRHLKIGYNRAAKLMEEMEVAGIVSPMDGSGSRKVMKS